VRRCWTTGRCWQPPSPDSPRSSSAAVKDLRLGTLVGTRTTGGVAGPAASWLLDDHSVLRLPEKHFLGANKELIDTIGVAADRHAPLTAHDLSTGRDPGLATALRLLP
jgi:carboxyl-terminal processing protease